MAPGNSLPRPISRRLLRFSTVQTLSTVVVLEDPRIKRTKLHQLLDILVIAICAVICGADDWVEVELLGNAKLVWLRTFLELPNGIPAFHYRTVFSQEAVTRLSF